MYNIGIPFPYKNPKKELNSFYLSFLIRVFVIKGEFGYGTKIHKKDYIEAMKQLGWNKKRYNETWNKATSGIHIKEINKLFLILNGKESIIEDKGFITKVDNDFLDLENISYYKFCAFVTETYAIRPVTQKQEFYSIFKFKRKNKTYNKEILKKSLETKQGRGQRKISDQSGCCLKTANNRLKKSKQIKTLKRYDNLNGIRINKTNLYFTNNDRVFLYYMKNNTTQSRRIPIKSDHSSLIKEKALFLNGSKGLNYGDNTIYLFINHIEMNNVVL